MLFAFGLASLHRGNPYRLYQPSRVHEGIENDLDAERQGSITGWPRRGEFPVRQHPPLKSPTCGTAWGGSFTWSDDVAESEAWPYVLSTRLGCQIDNRGIDGFGLDQTFLHYREHPGRERLVVLGLAEPMMFIDAVTSMTFLQLTDDRQPRPQVIKPLFSLHGDQLVMTPRPPATAEAIAEHYSRDRVGQDWTPLRFPFTPRIGRALFRKYRRIPFGDAGIEHLADPDIAALNKLASRLVTDMAHSARDRGQAMVVLFIPRPGDLRDPNPIFQRILDGAGPPNEAICAIDPAPELKAASPSNGGGLATPSSHFNAAGNEALANAVQRGLRSCGLSP